MFQVTKIHGIFGNMETHWVCPSKSHKPFYKNDNFTNFALVDQDRQNFCCNASDVVANESLGTDGCNNLCSNSKGSKLLANNYSTTAFFLFHKYSPSSSPVLGPFQRQSFRVLLSKYHDFFLVHFQAVSSHSSSLLELHIFSYLLISSLDLPSNSCFPHISGFVHPPRQPSQFFSSTAHSDW